MQRELPPMLDGHRGAIIELCMTRGVTKLDVFGSACAGQFDDSTSDLDVIAAFADTGPGYADRYLDFANGLEAIVGRPVDALTPASLGPGANEIFMRTLSRCWKVVYKRASGEAAA